MKKIIFLTASIFLLSAPALRLQASIHQDAGTRGAAFLRIGPSARASGFGGAYTAVPGEAASIDWNPSGIATIRAPQVSATYGNWFAESKYGNFGLAMPAGNRAALGLSYTYLDYGTLTRTSGQDMYGVPVEDGTFGATDMNLALAYARSFLVFSKEVLFGVAAKATRLAIDQDSAAGYAGDAGFSVLPDKKTVISIAGRNFGNIRKIDQVEEQLSQEFAFGISRFFGAGSSKLLVTIDAVAPIDNYAHYRGGVEYAFKDRLFLRAGSGGNYDTDGFTAGAGLALAGMRVDYAYAPFTVLGDTHRVTLTIFVGPAASKPHEPRSPAGKAISRSSLVEPGARAGTTQTPHMK